jgi:hypothetical protein
MKNKPVHQVRVRPEPSEELIRDYAEHLYEQSGRIPGRDLDNWLEARACLEANIPKLHSHRRLHRHLNDAESVEVCQPPVEAHNIAS